MCQLPLFLLVYTINDNKQMFGDFYHMRSNGVFFFFVQNGITVGYLLDHCQKIFTPPSDFGSVVLSPVGEEYYS